MATKNTLFDLSKAQLDIFLDQSIHQGIPHYNIGGYVVLHEAVDVQKFKDAHADEVAQHEALRLRFSVFDGKPQQYLDEAQPTLKILDFSSLEEPHRAAEGWLEHEFTRVFKLDAESLHVSALIRVSDAESWYCTVSHHLVIDGWGYGLWIRRLVANYLARTGRGEMPETPHLRFLESLSERTRRERGRSVDFGRQYLDEMLLKPVLEPRISVRELYPSVRIIRDLEVTRTRDLVDFAASHGFQLHHLLLSAMCVYFASLKLRNELLIGLPAHNRRGAEKQVIGSYVGVSLCRLSLPLDAGIVAMMAMVKRAMARCTRSQSIAEAARVAGEAGPRTARLFDLQFNYLKLDYRTDNRHLSTESHYLANRWSQVPFSLNICDFGEHQPVQLQVDVNEAFFSRREAELMLDRIEWIVDQCMHDTTMAWNRLALVPPGEKRWLMHDLGTSGAHEYGEEDLWQRFEAVCERSPDAVALRSDAIELTYAEVCASAKELAVRLAAKSTNPSRPLALCMQPNAHVIISMLAALILHRPFVPLDLRTPLERLRVMLEDASPEWVLVDSAGRIAIAALGCQCVDVDETGAASTATQNAVVHDIRASAVPLPLTELAAWIIYTSGSTGTPKGVVVPHSAVIRLVDAPNFMVLSSETVMLQAANLAFDVSTFEIWGALLNGGTLVLMEQGITDLDVLNRTIDTHRVNTMWLTAGLFDRWVDRTSSVPGSLKYVLAGGDVVPPRAVRRLQQMSSSIIFVNGYGPTENGVFSACGVVSEKCDGVQSIPIGKPVNASTAYVVDATGRVSPFGEPGELWVGGAGLALGYYGLHASDERKFVIDPTPEIRGRIYKTGDMVRWREDGQLDYLGRIDQQVKIRGFRIELEEIEIRLRELPEIAEATVVVIGEAAVDKSLRAYIRPAVDSDPTALLERAARFLRERLPEYMVPSRFVVLDEMPLNANGKVDRSSLRRMDCGTVVQMPFTTSMNELEREVLRLWSVALPGATIDAESDFFANGGHSLSAMHILSEINELFGIELSLGELLKYPTVREQATLIERATETGMLRPGIVCGCNADDMFPMSFVQQQIWLSHQLNGGSHEYNVPGAFRLRGSLDTNALEAALQRIVERHRSLSCRVLESAESAVLTSVNSPKFSLSCRDLTVIDPALRDVIVTDAIRAEYTTSFALESSLPIRAAVLTLAPRDHVFLLTFHHIAIDGWSLEILQRELTALYREYTGGPVAELPELRLSYADFASYQRRVADADIFPGAVRQWRLRLEGAPTVHELSLDKPRPDKPSHRGRILRATLDATASQALYALASAEQLSLFGLLQTAFAVIVGEFSRQRDVLVGTPVSGRAHSDLYSTIGCFINTVVVRTRYDGQHTLADVAATNHHDWVDLLRYHHVPFAHILKALSPVQSRSINPLFQLWFVLQPQEPASLTLSGVDTAYMPPDEANIKFDLMVSAIQAENGLRVEWQYAEELFEQASMVRMLDAYTRLLSDLQKLIRVPITSLPQRLGLDASVCSTPMPLPYDPRESIAGRMFLHARMQPDTPAVSDGNRTLTYEQLAQRVRRLSGLLAECGVRRGDCVAVCADRTIGGVIALLAIQSLGAAYLPLDAKLPAERMTFMLEDAQAGVLVTDSAFASQTAFGNLDVVLLDDVLSDDWLQDHDDAAPEVAVISTDAVAYMIYTSGSTGMPKGVRVTRGNLAHYVAAMTSRYGFDGCRRYAVNSAFHTDLGNTTLYLGLWHGGCLQLMDAAMMLDGAAVSRCVRNHDIDVMKITPGHFAALCDDELYEAPVPKRLLIFGGEVLHREVLETIRSICLQNSCRVINHYGPTEATIGCITHEIDLNRIPNTSPLGLPLPGETVRIMDGEEILPRGAWGELVVSGPAISLGYNRNETLTAEVFSVTLGADGVPTRHYRTGDRARLNTEGLIEFGGRFDDQVKIRGFRIELAEIDACLLRVPNMTQSVTIVHLDQAGQSVLVSFVVADDFEVAETMRELARTLPDYMLPKRIVRLDRMPLLGNGKPDRRALASHAELRTEDAYQAPKTATEASIHRIMSELLRCERLSVEQRFFDVGGNSLLVTRLANELNLRMGLRLPVHVLMENHSTRSLSALVDTIVAANAPHPLDANAVEVEI